ncbi:MAG: efflux transporter outer membrane subunit [Pseudomonadota bacterium]
MPIFMRCVQISVMAPLLVGCATVATGTEAASERATASLPELPQDWSALEQEIVGEPVGWIAAFDDPVLSALVAEAQENNNDLAAAAANVESARALAGVAGAALSPQVAITGGSSNAGVLDGGDTSGLNLGAQASWEVDLWGRLRSGRQAAVRGLEAAEADFLFSQYSIAAAVADTYFLAIEADRQLAVVQSQVEALAEIDRIVTIRFDNGIGNAQDVALSKSDLASARDGVEELQGAKRDALRALEILLGRYPGADLTVRNDLPAVPAPPPAGIPSDVLERRPDIIAAERRIASAIKSVDEAKAAKLPSLNLTGSLGGSSNDLTNILDPTNIAWTAASSLLAPVIDGGRLDSQVDLAEADVEAAVATYAQTALNAFSDVEGALDQSVVLRHREAELNIAASEAREALRLANLRYEEGETDLIDVLAIQNRVLNADSALVTVQRSQLSEFVALNLALGGSWE